MDNKIEEKGRHEILKELASECANKDNRIMAMIFVEIVSEMNKINKEMKRITSVLQEIYEMN